MKSVRSAACCLALAVCASAASGQAADSMLYPLGIDLDALAGGAGWSDAWNDGVVSSTVFSQITGPGLFYPGLLSGGGCITWNDFSTSETRYTRTLGSRYSTNSGQTDVFWLSALIRFEDPNPDPGANATIRVTTAGVNGYAAVLLRPGQSIILEAREYNTLNPVVTDDSGVVARIGQTHLIVMRGELGSTGGSQSPTDLPDTFSLWIDPDLSVSLGAPDAVVTNAESGLNTFQFRAQRTAPGGMRFDEVRIGDTAAAVLPAGSGCDADVNGDGLCTPADFNAWILNFNAGC